jgi:hypothetical protein
MRLCVFLSLSMAACAITSDDALAANAHEFTTRQGHHRS